jgi:maleylacetoacetate isomerase
VLHLKGLDNTVRYCYINIARDEHLRPSYNEISSSNTLPCLVVEESTEEQPETSRLVISQSVAILEFIEERFPTTTPHLLPPLLPSLYNEMERYTAITKRSKVRTLVNIVVADWQPLANLSPLRKVVELSMGQADSSHRVVDGWLEWCHMRGMHNYENYVKNTAGYYSVGNEISLADVVLVPAVENWLRLDLESKEKLFREEFPTTYRIVSRCRQLEAFRKAHWTMQQDNDLTDEIETPSFLIGGIRISK